MKTVMKTVAMTGLALSLATAGASAQGNNPIFGGAKVTTMTAGDNAKVAGKGAYANYYGYYGYLYSYYATSYAYNARFVYGSNSSAEYTAYYNAYVYSSTAADLLYYAYYYSYNGL